MGHGEAGVDDVMPDALVAQVDFEAVVEEGEEVGCFVFRLFYLPFTPIIVFIRVESDAGHSEQMVRNRFIHLPIKRDCR